MPDTALLGPELPTAALGFMLVLVRVSVAVMLLPGIGEMDPPPLVRAGLAIAMTVLVAPGQLGNAPDAAEPLAMLVTQLLRELFCGLFLGFTARVIALALPIAAELMTLFIGLSSVIQPDPQLGPQSSALARLFSLAVPVLLLASGLYALPVGAVADSYRMVPLGGEMLSGDVTAVILESVRRSFDCAFRLAVPFVLAGTLWQLCLGLLARFVPALPTGSIMAPGQLLGGLVLLALLSGVLLSSWRVETAAMFGHLGALMRG